MFLDSFGPVPANTQSCDSVVAGLQRHKTNAQRCSDIDVTTAKLQRSCNVTSTMDSTFNVWCTLNVVLKTLLQRLNSEVKLTNSSEHKNYGVKFTV